MANRAEMSAKVGKRVGVGGARRVQMAVLEDVKITMYKWFVGIWSHKVPISGLMVEQKVKDLAFLCGRKDFQGGSG